MKNSLAPSKVTTLDPKGIKFIQIVADAYNKAGLTDGPEGTPEGEAQRVNNTPGLNDVIAQWIEEHRYLETFEGEEVPSNYRYLSGHKPEGEDLDRQIGVLQKLFPGLGGPNPEYLQLVKSGAVKVPTGGEKFFAIPNIWKKGGQAAIGATYSECVQKVLDLIKQTRNGKFYNHREGSIDEKHLRQLAKSKEALEAISEDQGNPETLIVPAQFGKRHAGRSVRRARVVMTSGEFGLGAFANGCMLLTHSERLQRYDDLWIDLAGDEFSPDGDGGFSRAPFFFFLGGKVEFGARFVDDAGGLYGSASGFPSQS